MKVLEVHSLQNGTNDTLNKIDTVQDQIEAVRKAMGDFSGLNNELNAKGGDALRLFYEECHQPFLIFLHQSLLDYKNKLNELQGAVDSFESNENGYVCQNYLEDDVENAFDTVEKKTVELTEEANTAIEDILDIATVTKLNESEFVNNVQRGKRKLNSIVERLHEIDDTHSESLDSVLSNLTMMKTYVSDINSKISSGDISVDEYKTGDLTMVDAYSSMMESIYDSETIDPLLEKMKNKEELTPLERDILYIYFQHEYLTEKSKRDMKEVASYINENNIDKLEDHLNNNVITSQEELEKEMGKVQAYVFLGTKSPSTTGIENRTKMEAYLMLLKEYHLHIVGRDEVIRVQHMKYEDSHEGVSGHYLEAGIESFEYHGDKRLMSKEKFREVRFADDQHFFQPKIDINSVLYAEGPYAGSKIKESELNKLQNELADYEANFIAAKAANQLIASLAKKADISGYVKVAQLLVGYDKGKEKITGEIEVGNALTTAHRLGLEISIGQTRYEKGIDIQFYPMDNTFDKIDRWRELAEINPDIPFPEEAINKHDWKEIGNKLGKVDNMFESETMEYIYDGNKNGETVESLANAKR